MVQVGRDWKDGWKMPSKLSREYRFKTEKCDAKVRFLRTKYTSNGSTAIVMYVESDYSNEYETVYEPYATLTVNLLDPFNEYLQFIDVNNLGEMTLDWLARKGIATYTDYDQPSGFCIYPLVEFDHKFIDGLKVMELEGSYISVPKRTKVNA